MEYEDIQVTPLTPRIGAEVTGINLTKALGNQQFQELHDALMEHSVLFFRDQDVDIEQHKNFGRLFGELHIHPGSPPPPGHPEILIVHADKNSKHVAGENWHSDVTCDEEPPMGSILHLWEVPKSGGDTLFASMEAAYDSLSDRMKNYLGGLTATHSGEQVYRGRYNNKDHDDANISYPKNIHPVIRTHPITGKKSIFVNKTFTTRINELPREESEGILSFLYSHCAKPDYQVRFKWQSHSIAFWDNRCVQHLALWDYYPQVRSGYRVTIKGDKPF
ncbi:MAG: taurine dioxygenase [Rhodospirillaceae bacterium]|nr:taurine dioxygenase [Rhodospirillaceae bacterium]|tara:strand:+ start:1079 stop:1906 length:828 start_codon:yes stop_codon:yes gene_type:complete